MNDADRCILDHFARVRNRTIELARQLPGELLARTAEGEEQSLFWLLVHIADAPNWWMTHVAKDGGSWAPSPPFSKDRASVLDGLVASRDRVVHFFEADDGRRMGETFSLRHDDGSVEHWTGRDRVLYYTDHELHHRGRIVLALLQWSQHGLLGEGWLWPPTAD